MIGVYCIKNIQENKYYIGSSFNIQSRKWNHFSALRHQKHHSIHLQRAWNKYGKDVFVFDVLQTFNEIEEKELRKIELQYIAKFDSYKNGYNVSKRTDCPKTEHAWNKGLKFKNWEGKNHIRSKPIVGLSENGELIKEFESIHLAERFYKSRSIGQCIAGKSKKAQGLYWFYKEDYINNEYEIILPKTKNVKRVVLQIDEFGNVLNEYNSVSDVAKAINSLPSNISACCSSKHDTMKVRNKIFVYKDEYDGIDKKPRYKPVYNEIKINMLLSDGSLVREFNSISEAAKYLNKAPSLITRVKNTEHMGYGYFWRTK